MTERVKKYMAYIDSLIESNDPDTDWDEETARHLVQIKFFMHERFIHLIVTVLFALMAIMVLGIFLLSSEFSWPVMVLFLLIMVLLVPYVKHYYLLENSVQYMYVQYDRMLKASGKKAFFIK